MTALSTIAMGKVGKSIDWRLDRDGLPQISLLNAGAPAGSPLFYDVSLLSGFTPIVRRGCGAFYLMTDVIDSLIISN